MQMMRPVAGACLAVLVWAATFSGAGCDRSSPPKLTPGEAGLLGRGEPLVDVYLRLRKADAQAAERFLLRQWIDDPAAFPAALKARFRDSSSGSPERWEIALACISCPQKSLLGEDFVRELLLDSDFKVRAIGLDVGTSPYDRTGWPQLRETIWQSLELGWRESQVAAIHQSGRSLWPPQCSELFRMASERRKDDAPRLIALVRIAAPGSHLDDRPSGAQALAMPSLHLLTGKFFDADAGADEYSTTEVWAGVAAEYEKWYDAHKDLSDEEFFLRVAENNLQRIGKDAVSTQIAYVNICCLLGMYCFEPPWRYSDGQLWREFMGESGKGYLTKFADDCQQWWRAASPTLRWDPESRTLKTPHAEQFRELGQAAGFTYDHEI